MEKDLESKRKETEQKRNVSNISLYPPSPLPGLAVRPFPPVSGVLSSGPPRSSSARPTRLAPGPSPPSSSNEACRSPPRSATHGWCPRQWYHPYWGLEEENDYISIIIFFKLTACIGTIKLTWIASSNANKRRRGMDRTGRRRRVN